MHDNAIHVQPEINVGIAVALEEGLIVPVVKRADQLPLSAIAAESRRFAQAARVGRLALPDLEGGTFTVSTLGSFGIDFFTPVITPGQVAILGVGRLRDSVRWEGATPVRTQVLTLSITFDHRAVDGAPAADYLRSVVVPSREPAVPARLTASLPPTRRPTRGGLVRALQLKSFQSDPELVDLPEPEPGPGQVVVKVGGAGACHSDLHVMREFADGMAPWGPPFVIGHEAAGWVHRVGERRPRAEQLVSRWRCTACSAAGSASRAPPAPRTSASTAWRARRASGSALTAPWPSTCSSPIPRRLVPIGDLDPVDAAPLDRRRAHAVPRRQAGPAQADARLARGGDRRWRSRSSRHPDPRRADPGQGHRGGHAGAGAQRSPAEVGAVATVLAGDDAAAAVIDATHGAKADVVLDFVGAALDHRARRGGRPGPART